eukprot:4669196-Pyramimonas_sp.AAC.1
MCDVLCERAASHAACACLWCICAQPECRVTACVAWCALGYDVGVAYGVLFVCVVLSCVRAFCENCVSCLCFERRGGRGGGGRRGGGSSTTELHPTGPRL